MSEVAPALEQVLRQVRSRGLRVDAWWHRRDGWWQAGLRTADNRVFFRFGIGPDAAGAIEAALEQAVQGRRAEPAHRQPADDERLVGAAPPDVPRLADLEDIL